MGAGTSVRDGPEQASSSRGSWPADEDAASQAIAGEGHPLQLAEAAPMVAPGGPLDAAALASAAPDDLLDPEQLLAALMAQQQEVLDLREALQAALEAADEARREAEAFRWAAAYEAAAKEAALAAVVELAQMAEMLAEGGLEAASAEAGVVAHVAAAPNPSSAAAGGGSPPGKGSPGLGPAPPRAGSRLTQLAAAGDDPEQQLACTLRWLELAHPVPADQPPSERNRMWQQWREHQRRDLAASRSQAGSAIAGPPSPLD